MGCFNFTDGLIEISHVAANASGDVR
jgi:hypothetical protein